MKAQPTIKTGTLVPRDYGISLKQGLQKSFVNPFKYVLGKVMLEIKGQLNERLKEKARREGVPIRELQQEFYDAVDRKEKSNILYTSQCAKELRETVASYHNGALITAQLPSKSLGSTYDVFLGTYENSPFSTEHRCTCKDNMWNTAKIQGTTVCPHVSALEIAVVNDNESKQSVKKNVTGLYPSQRPQHLMLPFNVTSTQEGIYELVNDALVDHYLNNKGFYEINRALLEHPELYSSELQKRIESESFGALYQVLLQNNKEVDVNGVTVYEKRMLGAQNALTKRLIDIVSKEKEFNFDGYGVEFKNTEFETVARRFRKGYQVYSICQPDGCGPLVVRKNLGEKVSNIYNSRDNDTRHPLTRTSNHLSIDDATRREALTRVLVPGQSQESLSYVPDILKGKYRV